MLAIVCCGDTSGGAHNQKGAGGDDTHVTHGDTSVSDSGGSEENDNDGDGYSPSDGDCADDDATMHPAAADEPLDGVDNDCSGPDQINLEDGSYTLMYSSGVESAYQAESSALLDDLWGDGLAEVMLMDDDNEDPWATPWWHTYIFDSEVVSAHPDQLLPEDARLELRDNEAEYGFESYSVGDVDGDLLPDLVTADAYYRHGAYLFRGSNLATMEGVVDVDEVHDIQFIPSGTPGEPCYDVASGFLSDPLHQSADIAMLFLYEPTEDAFISVVRTAGLEDGVYYTDGFSDTTIYSTSSGGYEFSLTGLAGVGDLDGDGLDELEVDFRSPYPSRTYAIFPGGSLDPGAVLYASDADITVNTSGIGIEESEYGRRWNTIVLQGGDIDGDGINDLIMGVPNRIDESGEDTSSAWIWSGSRLMEGGERHITDGDVEIIADHIYQQLGERATSLGDMDRDGRGDIMIHSSKGAIDDPEVPNSVALIFMGDQLTFGSTISTEAANFMLFREDGWEGAWTTYTGSMSGGKDVDGDGVGDAVLSIAKYGEDLESRAYFIPGWEL